MSDAFLIALWSDADGRLEAVHQFRVAPELFTPQPQVITWNRRAFALGGDGLYCEVPCLHVPGDVPSAID